MALLILQRCLSKLVSSLRFVSLKLPPLHIANLVIVIIKGTPTTLLCPDLMFHASLIATLRVVMDAVDWKLGCRTLVQLVTNNTVSRNGLKLIMLMVH